MVNGHEVPHEEVTVLSADKSVLLWPLKREILILNPSRLNILLNKFQKLVGEIFVYSFTAFDLIKLVIGRRLPLSRLALQVLQHRRSFLQFSSNTFLEHFKHKQLQKRLFLRMVQQYLKHVV